MPSPMRICCALAVLLPLRAADPIPLTTTAKSFTQYPSMEPVSEIDVTLSDPPALRDVLNAAIKGGWDCTAVGSYRVTIVNGTTSRDVPIASVNPARTHCTVNDLDLNTVELQLRNPISDKDKYQVALRNLPGIAAVVQSAAAAGPQGGSNIAFAATPQSAAGETLTNKTKRDTGQIAVSFTNSDFVRNLPVDVYVKSTDLFSTDERDSKSAFLGMIGISRGLFPDRYSPAHLEVGMQGNQVASSLSGVANMGITTLLPWKSVLQPAIQVPLPPDFTMNAQYTNRLRQDPTVTTRLAANDFTVNPSIAWTAISFPWTCRIFGWLNGDKTTAATPATDQYKYCAGVEFDIGLWYLPLDLTGKGSQRVEGYGDVSFLIPLSSLSFARSLTPYLTSGDSAKSRIRVKYSDTVNATNNYVRAKSWSYGIELTK